MKQPQTLINLLRQRADAHPDELAYQFLEDGNAPGQQLTYGMLDDRARAIGSYLQSQGAAGARALLLYPAGLDFLTGFFGCLYAGVVAIPAPPPEASRMKRTGPRLRAIIEDAEAALVVSTSAILGVIEQGDNSILDARRVHLVATDRLGQDLQAGWVAPTLPEDQLAYLQYTSGSTTSPRGVMISHKNILLHSAYLQSTCSYDAGSATVTWMPHFHDYGLVEGLLQPLYNGTPCYVLSPFSFIKRPLCWLQAITQYRATHSQAPNFAYDQCVRRVTEEQGQRLDLSSWRAAGIAAEPINPRVIDAFLTRFERHGFRRTTFCPAYGLAEATLMVTFVPVTEEPRVLRLKASELEHGRCVEAGDDNTTTRVVVSCGRLFGTTQIAIVDPETRRPRAADEVGEIWVADPAIAQGYWRRPEETTQVFGARLADTADGPFLRTGDLGFLKDGHLYVTGRLKDVIIIRGANHYPQDIERTVQKTHEALRPDFGAAFSIIDEGEEKLVVVQEVEREYAPALDATRVFEAIRQAIAEEHLLDVFAIQLLKRGSIIKTASGKIQHQACRKAFLENEFEVLASWIAGCHNRLNQRANTENRLPSAPA